MLPSRREDIKTLLSDAFAGIEFETAGHKYKLNGKAIPSVTTILGKLDKSNALLYWASKMAQETGDPWAWRDKREQAANLGTEAHSLIEHELNVMLGIEDDARPDVSDDAHYVFSGWKEWAAGVNLMPVMVEQPVYSLDPRYAGKPDVLAYVNDVLTVCDWKSSKGGRIYDEHKLQNYAYRYAISKAIGFMPAGTVVILPKEGPKLEVLPVDIPWSDSGMDAFRGLFHAYCWCSESAKEERARKVVA